MNSVAHEARSNHRVGEQRGRVLYVMEQTLGHITHTKNLQGLVPRDGVLQPEFLLIPYETRRRLPGWSNWTIRAGVCAGGQLARRQLRSGSPDVAFFHTQVPAVLLGPWMRWMPSVVSIDATPKQYDELGDFYSHRTSHDLIEQMKFRANRACFRRARHIVSWSQWGKNGLVDEYDIDPAKITVIAPGVDLDRWRRPPSNAPRPEEPVRILFVGGDLRRKGGDLLVEAVRRLRDDAGLPDVELHLVTASDVEPAPGVVVHRGLTSNSSALIEQYHSADIFCLPTLGDCLPMVLAEAAASSLPLISTDVGAIGEIVRHGETGELVPAGDLDALTGALESLISDPARRIRYGAAARRLAETEHDARTNAGRIAAILESVAEGRNVIA